MLISRRAAIKGMLVTTVGAVTGAATYGVAFERHQIGVTACVPNVVEKRFGATLLLTG